MRCNEKCFDNYDLVSLVIPELGDRSLNWKNLNICLEVAHEMGNIERVCTYNTQLFPKSFMKLPFASVNDQGQKPKQQK